MANRRQYPALQLRGSNYEIAETRVPGGERLIEIGLINIDRGCFKKSAKEKEILKVAKLNCRLDELKR